MLHIALLSIFWTLQYLKSKRLFLNSKKAWNILVYLQVWTSSTLKYRLPGMEERMHAHSAVEIAAYLFTSKVLPQTKLTFAQKNSTKNSESLKMDWAMLVTTSGILSTWKMNRKRRNQQGRYDKIWYKNNKQKKKEQYCLSIIKAHITWKTIKNISKQNLKSWPFFSGVVGCPKHTQVIPDASSMKFVLQAHIWTSGTYLSWCVLWIGTVLVPRLMMFQKYAKSLKLQMATNLVKEWPIWLK